MALGYWDYRTCLAFIQAAREAGQHERVLARIYQALAVQEQDLLARLMAWVTIDWGSQRYGEMLSQGREQWIRIRTR